MFAVGDVVLEDGRHVFLGVVSAVFVQDQCCDRERERERESTHLREDALAVADQQTCLAAATVTNDNKLLRVRGRLSQASANRLAS